MRLGLGLACLSLTLVACGSSNDTSTPAAACNSACAAACNKASSCNLLNGTTVSACTTSCENAASCSTAACPSGQSYNSGAASQCITDINNLSCNTAGTSFPSSCDNVCR